ncbi:hypothetical protein [Paenibacillus zanthoxyli]|uniref:hypothetical protein n=1 Tax=Paenibacillus zanthoxyli TaxID=369399 RepID=UPI0012EBD9E6|nr:hypothetical protein [Paenibacillus zanthoxyli]
MSRLAAAPSLSLTQFDKPKAHLSSNLKAREDSFLCRQSTDRRFLSSCGQGYPHILFDLCKNRVKAAFKPAFLMPEKGGKFFTGGCKKCG